MPTLRAHGHGPGLHLRPLGPSPGRGEAASSLPVRPARPRSPVHNGRVSSEHLQALPGQHVPLPDGAVSAAREGCLVLQLTEGHVALVACR